MLSICFRTEIPLFGNFVSKNEHCYIKLKFGTYTKVDIQNSKWMLICFVVGQK